MGEFNSGLLSANVWLLKSIKNSKSGLRKSQKMVRPRQIETKIVRFNPGDFLSVLAKTQFVQNGKTQFEKAKTQFENWKSPTEQRFPFPVFSIPIPVLRLSSLGTRFRFRFWDCPWPELDSESGSETAQALNSILIPVPRLHRLRTRFWFRFRDCTCLELDSDSETIPSLDPRVFAFWFRFQIFSL